MPEIIAIGECMVEFSEITLLTRAGARPAPAILKEEQNNKILFQQSFGGDVLNTLVAASRLGTNCGFISQVGNDIFTPFLLNAWQKERIDIKFVRKIRGHNGIYFIHTDKAKNEKCKMQNTERKTKNAKCKIQSEKQKVQSVKRKVQNFERYNALSEVKNFTYFRKNSAASKIKPKILEKSYIISAKIIYSSGIALALSKSSQETVYQAFKIAKDAGVKVAFDPNFRTQILSQKEARKKILPILPLVDIFLPNSPLETQILFGIDNAEDAAKYLIKKGMPIVVIKMGKDGVIVGCKDFIKHIPIFSAGKILDTTGAGDAFNGGFLHGICDGKDILTSAKIGVITAGFAVTARGAIQALPDKNEISKLCLRYQG